jgi:hypothetical protein
MNDTRAFAPLYTKTSQNPDVQGTLQNSVAVAATDAPQDTPRFSGVASGNTNVQIQIANQSSSWAFVNFGVFGNVAPASGVSYPVAPGAVVVVTVDPEVTGASVVLQDAAATGSVIFTRGNGL